MKQVNLFIFFISYVLSIGCFATENTVRTKPLAGTIALTFDDGPSPIYTPQILAILKKITLKQLFSW